jgi:translocator protein
MNVTRNFNLGRLRSPLAFLLSVLVCFAALRLGALLTTPALEPWYTGLTKPSFTPPNWMFPVAWTTIFSIMAVALWRIVTRSGVPLARNHALIPFAVQLMLNVAWSAAFFAAQSPATGFAVILLLFGAIVWTILAFRRVDTIAAWLLAPYIVWVSYAAVLNAAIWRLNG